MFQRRFGAAQIGVLSLGRTVGAQRFGSARRGFVATRSVSSYRVLCVLTCAQRKCASICSSDLPLVSGRKKAATRKYTTVQPAQKKNMLA